MVVVEESTAVKRISRSFEGLMSNDTNRTLIITYREIIEVDGIEVSNIIKEYNRNYDYWKESQIGKVITGMIEVDLQQNDPSLQYGQNADKKG